MRRRHASRWAGVEAHATAGSRTRVPSLEGLDDNRYTTVAESHRDKKFKLSNVSKLKLFIPCEGCSALLIPALPCPISGVHSGKIIHRLGFWKLSPRISKSSPRRGCCVRQLGRVGRTSAGRQDELSDRRLAADPNGRARVLCWKVVKHATKPNNLSRSRLWSQLAPVR